MRLAKGFLNNLSANTKLSKTQLSKIGQGERKIRAKDDTIREGKDF